MITTKLLVPLAAASAWLTLTGFCSSCENSCNYKCPQDFTSSDGHGVGSKTIRHITHVNPHKDCKRSLNIFSSCTQSGTAECYTYDMEQYSYQNHTTVWSYGVVQTSGLCSS